MGYPASNISNFCLLFYNVEIRTETNHSGTEQQWKLFICTAIYAVYNTHTHNRFTALLELVRDHPGEQVPER